MSIIHVHLILNHIPIFTTIFSILFIIWGSVFNKKEIFKIGLIGFIIGAVAVIFVFLSGESSEEIVENIPGISERFLNNHQEFAEISLWLTLVLGVFGIAGFMKDKLPLKYNKLFVTILLIFSIITAGSLTFTAYLGGNIRHTELQQTPSNQSSIQSPVNNSDVNPDKKS